MVMAQLLSCYAISLPDARPVLPVGRLTIEPSYEPSFRLECLRTREDAARGVHSGAPALRRPSNKSSSPARNVGSSLTSVQTAWSREMV